jgi:hypothetical protein
MLKYCIRSFRLEISNSIEPYIYISVPGVVKEIHLLSCGIHKSTTQNLFDIDFGGLLPDGVRVTTHSAADNSFLNYFDLKFDVNQRIDGQYKISQRLADGTPLFIGTVMIYLRFGYE